MNFSILKSLEIGTKYEARSGCGRQTFKLKAKTPDDAFEEAKAAFGVSGGRRTHGHGRGNFFVCGWSAV